MSENNTKNWQKIKEESERDVTEMENEEDFDEEELTIADKNFTSAAALAHPDYTELEEKLTLAEQKAHENWEKSVRTMAELDNVRRRAEREISNAHRYGLEKMILSLLPIVDSLEQALQLAEKEAETAMSEGLQLTMKLFIEALQKQDVHQLDPQGEVFNPQEHEAMSMQEVEGAEPNTIVMVFQKGYKLNDRVIRPARVIVNKTKST